MHKTKPRPYQKEGVRLLARMKGRAILGDEQGLGKSPQALWYAQRYVPEGTVVIVCPASLRINWKREIFKHTGIHATVLRGLTPKKTLLRKRKARFFIISYSALGVVSSEDSQETPTWNDELAKMDIRLVIIDEAQNVKNKSALRTVGVKGLTRRVKKVLVLTGTPILSRPEELWSLLNIARPKLFPSYLLYCLRYCDPKKNKYGGWDFRGSSNLDELYQRCQQVIVRRLKKDVLKDLPPKIRQVVAVPLGPKAAVEYQEAESGLISWLSQTQRFLEKEKQALATAKWTNQKRKHRRAIKALKAQQLSKITYLKMLVGQLKLHAVEDWIKNFLETSDQKLLVFGIHHRVLRTLHKKFPKLSVLVDGAVLEDKRQNAFDRFNRDKTCRLLFGHMDAAGVGWSCVGTSSVLFAELAWTPGQHKQCEDRIHGVERGLPGVSANYWYLVGLGTIEENLVKMLDRKQEVIDRALDGKKGMDFNILEAFEDALLAKNRRKAVRRAPQPQKKNTDGRRIVHP